MKLFQLPTREVAVHLRLAGGEELDGHFFVTEQGPDGVAALLSRRLNDDSERFLPLAANGRVYLIRKAAVAAAALDTTLEESGHWEDQGARYVEVHVNLSNGISLEGRLPYIMPPERNRLVDFLNCAARFVPLEHDGRVTLFNRELVVSVWSPAESAGA